MGYWLKTLFGSTHVVQKLLFSIVSSILTFDFDLILGSVLTCWGPNRLLLGLGKALNTVLGSTHVAEQHSFSMISLILIDLTLG